MLKKKERVGLVVYLYYNRDVKKLASVGDVIYHSKKHRYLQLYVNKEEADSLKNQLSKERYIKKVRLCHIQDLDTNFVGSLYRNQENVII
ncbi:hypothetical protein STRDD11_00884 [Streptococcus sp. DD11]|uniref:YlbG family protein n=1 Tax=Streptococcus sp. DD11 TaxID=1777879 RepID=UPI000796A49F|nr:YlbG family protein [Streptococcus sp. DD11]KXT84586.1 hypothetical protein STRDD11_00884 [Streptococcus sp. DD11]